MPGLAMKAYKKIIVEADMDRSVWVVIWMVDVNLSSPIDVRNAGMKALQDSSGKWQGAGTEIENRGVSGTGCQMLSCFF